MLDISRIDLQNLDQEELQRVKLMLDISKIQQDIAASQAAVEEIKANTKKIEKEARFYPYVTLGSAMVGGLIVFVLTRFFA